jgi:hypothetical protein
MKIPCQEISRPIGYKNRAPEMADDCFDIWQPSLGVFSAPRVTETRAQEIELEQDIQASIFGIRRRLTQPNPVAKLSV